MFILTAYRLNTTELINTMRWNVRQTSKIQFSWVFLHVNQDFTNYHLPKTFFNNKRLPMNYSNCWWYKVIRKCYYEQGDSQKYRYSKYQVSTIVYLFIISAVSCLNLHESSFSIIITVTFTLWNETESNFEVDQYMELPKPVVIAVSACWVKRNTSTFKS